MQSKTLGHVSKSKPHINVHAIAKIDQKAKSLKKHTTYPNQDGTRTNSHISTLIFICNMSKNARSKQMRNVLYTKFPRTQFVTIKKFMLFSHSI